MALEDIFKFSKEPAVWRECADEVNAELLRIDLQAARRMPSSSRSVAEAEAERTKAMEGFKKILTLMQSNGWSQQRLQFTLGRCDTDCLLLLAERKIYTWQDIFNAKALHGTGDELKVIQRAALDQGQTVELTQALRAASKPALLVEGLRYEGNLSTVEQLLKMGADPGLDNGQLFLNAVSEGRVDIGRAFARHAQGTFLDVGQWMNWAQGNRKIKLFNDLREIWWDYGRFKANDRETLIETKPLPDNTGNLRIIYNFAARRVSEIYEHSNPRQALVKDFSFDDYGPEAVEQARLKLVELGGEPSVSGYTLRGKPVVPKASISGLGNKNS
jgi:hypothetical protein